MVATKKSPKKSPASLRVIVARRGAPKKRSPVKSPFGSLTQGLSLGSMGSAGRVRLVSKKSAGSVGSGGSLRRVVRKSRSGSAKKRKTL